MWLVLTCSIREGAENKGTLFIFYQRELYVLIIKFSNLVVGKLGYMAKGRRLGKFKNNLKIGILVK